MVAMITTVSTLFSIMFRTIFKPIKSSDKSKNKRSQLEDFDAIMNIFSMLNQALVKYGNMDTNVCVQRIVCLIVKNAVIDRKAKGKSASHYSRVIDGLSRYDWWFTMKKLEFSVQSLFQIRLGSYLYWGYSNWIRCQWRT